MVFLQLQANAASGMAVHDDCKLKFLELKAKRTYRFIVYKIEEKQKQVIVEKLVSQLKATRISLHPFQLMNAVIVSMILILSPQKTVRKARSSSLRGLLIQHESEAR
ncbi:hypothetical protein Dsin_033127 [Dipteronia sinensis]|uniref:ADF-H domain-containing protein n=1 Tax=Dipteronia sinensis TaxID=43782 RepID=A0AAE0DMA8_9ROSI|nr:hypothetical protein Dsin_033127 [Dipteronia sinensis]